MRGAERRSRQWMRGGFSRGDLAKSDNELFNRRYRYGRCWISGGGPRDTRPGPNLRAHLRLSVTRNRVALSSTNITFRRAIVYGENTKK